MDTQPVATPSHFAAEHTPLSSFQRGSARAKREDLPADCALACIAAFYPSESAMRDAVRILLSQHGLKPPQLALLGPRHADPAVFARQTLRWSGARADGSALPQLLAIAAGLSILALVIGWWVLASDTPLVAMLVGLVVLALAAGLLGDRLLWPWGDPPRARRFETSVRHQLSQGVWALVVYRIPRSRQAGVVALLRGASLRWCAVARPSTRL